MFGRRFATGGSTFYMGRCFTVRHMSCVSSPHANGFIAPPRHIRSTSADQLVKGATAFECDADVVEPAQPSATVVRAWIQTMCGTHLVSTFLKMSCMPENTNIKEGHLAGQRTKHDN